MEDHPTRGLFYNLGVSDRLLSCDSRVSGHGILRWKGCRATHQSDVDSIPEEKQEPVQGGLPSVPPHHGIGLPDALWNLL